jgi:geranylgeranyl reductase family protein
MLTTGERFVSSSYDVIIIGAGPAGSVAGINLSLAGYRVIVLEKGGIPRNKICGGGVTSRVLTRFPYLKSEIDAITLNKVSQICLYSPTLKRIESSADYLMAERSEFDARLADKCRLTGATVLPFSKVIQTRTSEEKAEVVLEDGSSITAKAIIGADGANSLTARSTGLSRKASERSVAVCLVQETTEEPVEIMDQGTMHVFYCYGNKAGYGWVFPKKRCINVGIGVLAHNHINIKELWKHFIQELKRQKIISKTFADDKFKGGVLPSSGPLPKTYSGRVLLCGDSGGFVNSFTGEGIYYAMISGEIAASVLSTALKKNDFSEKTLMQYQRLWKDEIGIELEKGYQISRILFKRPDLVEKIVANAAEKPVVKKVLSDYCVGVISYQDMKRVLVKRALPLCIQLKAQQFFNV